MTVPTKTDSFLNILKTQIAKYPKHHIEDLYKLIYQSEFAGGHLIKDEISHLNDLSSEMELSSSLHFKGLEWIDAHLCRIYLDELNHHIKATTLNRMVLLTSKQNQGCIAGLENRLKILKSLLSTPEVGVFLETMKINHYPLVSHSELYRKSYNPHYRMISAKFGNYFKVITQIDQLLKLNPRAVIAIDGMSGSGKSELAQILSDLFEADIIHMDHFFPKDSESQKFNLEINQINIDSLRYKKEVLKHLGSTSLTYQPYDCTSRSYLKSILIDRSKPTIIEGSYSLAKPFRDYYDFKIVLTCDPTTQIERIKKRNPSIDEHNILRWISYENAYFTNSQSAQCADILEDTTYMF